MIRGLGIASLAAVTGFALGCTDNPSAITESTPTRPDFLVSFGSTCDIRPVRSLSNTEFPAKDQKKVGDFIKLLGSGTTAQKQSAGFGLLDLLSKDLIAGTLASTHTAANASDLTVATADCIPNAVAPDVTELSKAFLTHGIYVVRGLTGKATESAIFSRDGGFAAVQAPTSGSGTGATPRDFFTWLGGPAVVFGWPIFSSTNEEFRFGETPVGVGYQLYAIRLTSSAFVGSGQIAICVGTFPSKLRIQHGPQIQVALNPAAIDGWTAQPGDGCPVPTGPLSLGERLLKAGFELLTPPPVFARGSTGASSGSGSFSPYGAVDAGSVNLTFTSKPATGTVGVLTPAAVVTATGNQGSPLPGVVITLTVSGNSGSFKVCGPNTVNGVTTATTDANGVADFSGVAIDKPGGYTLTATSSYAGFNPATVSTNPVFNLGNGSFTCP
jgi:hypothetical protein